MMERNNYNMKKNNKTFGMASSNSIVVLPLAPFYILYEFMINEHAPCAFTS